MIKLKNLFGMTKSYTIMGKEYIFKAFEEKEVPEVFLNPDGRLKFPGLKLIKTRIPKVIKTTELFTPALEDVKKVNHAYICTREHKVHEVLNLAGFASWNGIEYGTITNNISKHKECVYHYADWKIEKMPFEKYLEMRESDKYKEYLKTVYVFRCDLSGRLKARGKAESWLPIEGGLVFKDESKVSVPEEVIDGSD